MTETEAYDTLGWHKIGNAQFFILPISGSDRTDWEVYECPCDCGYRGLALPEARKQPEFMAECPRCRVPWIWR